MRRFSVFFLLIPLTAFCVGGRAAGKVKKIALRYSVPAQNTNVYRVEIETQGESGKETVVGDYVLNIHPAAGGLISVSARGQAHQKPGRAPSLMGYRPGYGPSLTSLLMGNPSEARELVFDEHGNTARQAGDASLPIPLGQLLSSLILKLPNEPVSSWEAEQEVFVLDEPLLLGPAPVFPSTMGGMGYQPFYPGRGSQGVLAARQHTQVKMTEVTAATVTLEKKATLKTICYTGKEPRVSSTTEGRLIIDTATGWPKTIEMKCNTIVLTENLSRRTALNLKWQLLEGAERDAALVPPSEQKPSPPDWTKLMNQLDSDDNFKRETAARQLTMSVNQSIAPPPELLPALAKLENDGSEAVRQAVFTVLAGFGTTDHVPLLLKGLRNPDDAGIRLACAKGLGRLKDPRAVEPLADLLAAGQTDQFSSRMSRPNPVMDALIHIGPEAETAVASLLQQKNVETLTQACLILKSVGTRKSLPALKELTGYPNKELSEAAADAVRSIQSREEK